MNRPEKNKPLVTIAIPTFNRRHLLERTVNSVLSQTYEKIEVIIADNGSGDETREYLLSLTDPRIQKLYGEHNIGMVGNWDRCLFAAKGEYFLLMSDDDMLYQKDAVDIFVSCLPLEDHSQTAFAFSDVVLERVDRPLAMEMKTGGLNEYKPAELIADFFNNKISVFPCATFFRTRDLLREGGYGAFPAYLAVDACAWITISFKYKKVVRIDQSLALYRIHQSLSSSSVETWSHDLTVIRNLVRGQGQALTHVERRKMEKAIQASWDRNPLGYIARKLRQDPDYRINALLSDIYSWRTRIFSFSNFIWVLGRLGARFIR